MSLADARAAALQAKALVRQGRDPHREAMASRARNHVPSVKELRAVWAAVEDEPMRDLVRFLPPERRFA
jgi:hypothetical protein